MSIASLFQALTTVLERTHINSESDQEMRKLNPFRNIPTIMTAEDIIEYAHSRSVKISMKSSLRLARVERTRIREITRLQEFTKSVKIKLKAVVDDFPTIDKLHPFYHELTEILVGIDKLKQSLGAVHNCIPPIDEITNKHLEALRLAQDHRQMKKTRRAAKGRISSILRATAKNVDFVIDAKRKMSNLPGIAPNSPTIVCAGFPNVGKSTLVRAVSSAEPEIAYYPFTTKSVIVGHLKIDEQNVQIVDTPGILDRPMSKRNEIERQAIAALKYLAHVIIFLIDPSEACGWTLGDQINLYNEVRRTFVMNPLFVAFNKIDITPANQLEAARKLMPDVYEIVATDGTGVEEMLRDAIEEVDLTSMEESVREFVSGLSRRESFTSDD